ncbi:MAG TPA: hypothetical protein VFE53_16115 [Mucilaginibacter sp.]|jgi:hypothetical protein|nr:hypothetical protein [Mucilaginibacter sp.]
MLIIFIRYIFVLLGFGSMALLPYNAFNYNKHIGPFEILEYLVPAFIFLAMAYRSYPRQQQRN